MIKVILFTILVAQVMGGPEVLVKKILENCNGGSGIDDAEVENFLYPKTNPNLKCVYACGAKALGAFVDGKIDIEAVNEMITKFHPDKLILIEKGKAVLESCDKNVPKNSDECEYIFKLTECMSEGRDKLMAGARK